MLLPTLKPSFRGITFLWDEERAEHDKRFANHDMPQKRGRWHEDMAAGTRIFKFDAWIIEPNRTLVYARLRQLEIACRNQRAGTLFHPWFGAVNVVNTGFSAKESTDTLNRIDLDLVFEEDNARQQPMATRSIGAALADAVIAAQGAIGDALDEFWQMASIPAYALSDANAAIGVTTLALLGATALLTLPVQAALSVACGNITSSDEISGLGVGMGVAFACFTTDSYGNPLQLSAAQADATYQALTPLATFVLAEEASDTASKATVAQAMAALSATVRRLALLQMANLTRQMTFVSSTDAIATRDALSDMMTLEIIAAADQASTNSDPEAARVSDLLDAARSEMVADLTASAATLIPVVSIAWPQSAPSGSIAYALYGDGDGSEAARANTLALEADMIARNGIQDPGQVLGGMLLEYLADAVPETG